MKVWLKYCSLLILMTATNPAANALPAQTLKGSRPNLILIMADDLGYGDLGCYGQQLIQTPNIDRLANEGVRFTQAYAGSTVCTASRAVLMTGLHNGHTAARDNIPHYATYLQDRDVTVAELLKSVGYRCGGIGKWSLGDAGSVGRATNQGFDSWLGYLNQDHAHYYYPEYLDDGDGRLSLEGNTTARHSYSHDLFTQRALSFIRENQDHPFFFYAAYTLPHFSSVHEDADGLTVPSTAPYADRDWEEHAKKYAAMITRLDHDVGRIVDLVDASGLRENTLIIFTSDNGSNENVAPRFRTCGPLRGFKRDLSEGGIRVPFTARWPSVTPAQQTSDAIVGFQDILPTFCELAGAVIPDNIDGLSIIDALRGQPLARAHDFLYWDYGHCRPRYDQAVRLNQWKAIRLGRESEIELYDLSKDIGELHNVAADNPQVVEQVAAIMQSAATVDDRYPIGKIYNGQPLWRPQP